MSESTVTTSAELNELFTALSKAQGELLAAKKDSTNPHFKSKFADLASIIEAARGPLSKHGLCVTQLAVNADGAGATIVTILGHSSGQWIRSELYMPATKPDAQGLGSCITYGRRYAYQSIIGLAAEEDDDGNEASKAVAKKPFDKEKSILLEKALANGILDTKTVDALKKVGASVKAASNNNDISDEQRLSLSSLYEQQRKNLTVPAPAESGPKVNPS